MRYRVNPFCPFCREEHAYYDIELSADDEKTLNELNGNLDRENLNELGKIIKAKPVIVSGTFKCPVCGHIYKADIPVYTYNRTDWVSSEGVGVGSYKATRMLR